MGARARARLEQVPPTAPEASSQVRGLAGAVDTFLFDSMLTCADLCIFLRLFVAGYRTRGTADHWLVRGWKEACNAH